MDLRTAMELIEWLKFQAVKNEKSAERHYACAWGYYNAHFDGKKALIYIYTVRMQDDVYNGSKINGDHMRKPVKTVFFNSLLFENLSEILDWDFNTAGVP